VCLFFHAGVKALPNLPHRASKPIFDKVEHGLFEAAIQQMVGSSNAMLELKALKRFEDEGLRQQTLVENEKDFTRSQLIADVDRVRKERLQHRREEQEFMRTWNEVNVIHWIRNQETAQERRMVKLRVLRKLARDRRSLVTRLRNQAIKEVRVDLESFDVGKKDEVALEQAPQGASAEENFRLAMRLIKRKKKDNMSLEQLRESRRRKFMFEDDEAQLSAGGRGVEELLKEQLNKKCVADGVLDLALETITVNEKMFVENREFREKQYADQAAVDKLQLQAAHQAIMQTILSGYELDVEASQARYRDALEARSAARKVRITEFCLATTQRLVELALEAAASRAFQDFRSRDAILPRAQWHDMLTIFLAPAPPLKTDVVDEQAKTWGLSTSVRVEESEQASTEVIDRMSHILEETNLKAYLEGSGPGPRTAKLRR
jgi:hypothetical protein